MAIMSLSLSYELAAQFYKTKPLSVETEALGKISDVVSIAELKKNVSAGSCLPYKCDCVSRSQIIRLIILGACISIYNTFIALCMMCSLGMYVVFQNKHFQLEVSTVLCASFLCSS